MAVQNLYGVGFSPLSIKNKKHALDGEMLADKDLGLFGIYDVSTGMTKSSQYLTRCQQHLEQFAEKCIRDNTLGVIRKLLVSDGLVKTVTSSINLFTNTVEIPLESEPSSIRFDIDMVVFEKSDAKIIRPDEVTAEIEFTMIKNGVTRTYKLSGSIPYINNHAFKLNWAGFGETENNTWSIRLNTFTINPPADFDSTAQTIGLYQILFNIVE